MASKISVVINLTYEDYRQFTAHQILKEHMLEDDKETSNLHRYLAKANPQAEASCLIGVLGQYNKNLVLEDYLESDEYNYHEILSPLPDSILAEFAIDEESVKAISITAYHALVDILEQEECTEEDIELFLKQEVTNYTVDLIGTLGIIPEIRMDNLQGAIQIGEDLSFQMVKTKEELQKDFRLGFQASMFKGRKEQFSVLAERQLSILSDAPSKEGPCIISEDLIRMLKLYNANASYKKFDSIRNEINFLYKSFDKQYIEYLEKGFLIPIENMDIIWAFDTIQDRWAKLRYFNKKTPHLKYLKDILVGLEIYECYEDMEAFKMLDNVQGVQAVAKESTDLTPLAYDEGRPITDFHKQLVQDSQKVYNELPTQFSCLGYNFTKNPKEAELRTTCGLALYKLAEFDVSEDGFLVTPENIKLYDFKKFIKHKKPRLEEVGSVEKLQKDLKDFPSTLLTSAFGDKALALDNFFTQTQESKLNPLLGNNDVIKKLFKQLNL